jgi:uncharacterized membrane protein YtjA (UPF0391 family)
MVIFAILAIIFGVWGFGTAAATAWAGVQVLFWVFLVLFILSLIGWGGGYWRGGYCGRGPLP